MCRIVNWLRCLHFSLIRFHLKKFGTHQKFGPTKPTKNTWNQYQNNCKLSICRLMRSKQEKKHTLNSAWPCENYLNEIESPQNANTLRFFNTHTLLKINAEFRKLFLCPVNGKNDAESFTLSKFTQFFHLIHGKCY